MGKENDTDKSLTITELAFLAAINEIIKARPEMIKALASHLDLLANVCRRCGHYASHQAAQTIRGQL